MATSIFLARLLGPILLAVGAGILINPKPFHTMASEVVRSITLVYLFGLADFAAGLAIVLTHNVWAANWRVLITLIGWLMLIRGAVRILAPEAIMGFAGKVIRNRQLFPISGVVTGVLGLVFCYFGYTS
jgi:hypothetical protein